MGQVSPKSNWEQASQGERKREGAYKRRRGAIEKCLKHIERVDLKKNKREKVVIVEKK